jgi:hypothetical protein
MSQRVATLLYRKRSNKGHEACPPGRAIVYPFDYDLSAIAMAAFAGRLS